MTASKKVLLAVVIVSAGYGLAALCGAPAKFPELSRLHGGAPAEILPAAAAPSLTDNSPPPPGHWALDSARLIPDPRSTQSENVPAGRPPFAPNPFESRLSTLEPVNAPPSAAAIASVASPRTAVRAPARPRARLRNEAPRALAVEAPAPAVVKSLELLAPLGTSDPVQQTQLLAAPAISSYETVSSAPGTGEITPQPYPPADNARQPRRHIIVDGDSLARLAGRYLDDPHRSQEIFELNRHVLSDPELLPIGAELEIPSRDRARTSDIPQSFFPHRRAIHSASRGLVPVRAIPSSPLMTPRAQLSRPQPAE